MHTCNTYIQAHTSLNGCVFVLVLCVEVKLLLLLYFIQVARNDEGLEAIVFTAQGDMRQVIIFFCVKILCDEQHYTDNITQLYGHLMHRHLTWWYEGAFRAYI